MRTLALLALLGPVAGSAAGGGPYGYSPYQQRVEYLAPAYNPSYYDSTAYELAQMSQQLQQLTTQVQVLLQMMQQQQQIAYMPPAGAPAVDRVEVALRSHGCAECHTAEQSPQGNLALFQGGRLARQVDWASVCIKVESNEMPKGGHKPLTADEKRLVRQRWQQSRRTNNHP